jgi:hypothetical protein
VFPDVVPDLCGDDEQLEEVNKVIKTVLAMILPQSTLHQYDSRPRHIAGRSWR